jgi:Ca2+-binding RTX toxin-like protein
MAIHNLNTLSHRTWEIDASNDTWVLGVHGMIIGNDMDGVHASDAISEATIKVDGSIILGGDHAGMNIQSDHASLTIGKDGYVWAGTGINYANLSGSATIYNRGLLEGGNGIAASTVQEGAIIHNSGRIDVSDTGIHLTGADGQIANDRVIKAATAIQLDAGDNDNQPLEHINATHIVNEGKIIGTDTAIAAGDVAVNINNRGLISGQVQLGSGDDILFSRLGTVKGDILAGAGDDIIDMVGSLYKGTIHGGLGDDTFRIDSAETNLVELDGAGVDTVTIDGSYTLGGNLENLFVTGAGNHTGVGNELDNRIRGNSGVNSLFGMDGNDVLDGRKGHDTLTGGAGADCFVFKNGYGSDLIMDFADGTDHIDLHGAAGIDDFGDLTGKITQVGDNLIITLNDYDHLVLKNAALNETQLTADDFIF